MTNLSDVASLSGARKAAILLTVLGDECAATVFRHLDEVDMQRVADEVVGLGAIPMELSLQVFEEYERMTQAQEFLIQGDTSRPGASSSRPLAKLKPMQSCRS